MSQDSDAMKQDISKQKIINDIEFQRPQDYDTIKEHKVNVSFVQGAIEKLVTQMNRDLVNVLNVQLEGNDTKLTKLIDEVGSTESGLIQDIAKLDSRITGLEVEEIVGENVWS